MQTVSPFWRLPWETDALAWCLVLNISSICMKISEHSKCVIAVFIGENHTSTRRHLTLCYVDTQHSLYVCLPVCLIVCLVRLDLSIRLFVNLFVCSSIYSSVRQTARLSVCLPL